MPDIIGKEIFVHWLNVDQDGEENIYSRLNQSTNSTILVTQSELNVTRWTVFLRIIGSTMISSR